MADSPNKQDWCNLMGAVINIEITGEYFGALM